MCVCFLPIHSGHQVRWTYQLGSHRRKVTHCYIPSSVAVHYLKTELTYLSSQSPGVSIHHSTIIARVISLLLDYTTAKSITASSRTPDFDRRYLPLEHWCLYNSSSIFENDLRYTNSQRLVVLFSILVIAVCFLNSQRLVVCVCFLPIHSGHQVRWTYQLGSHRRKVTHCYIPSSVAVHYLKTELTYLSSQSPGVSIHHSTIIARVISLLLVLYY